MSELFHAKWFSSRGSLGAPKPLGLEDQPAQMLDM